VLCRANFGRIILVATAFSVGFGTAALGFGWPGLAVVGSVAGPIIFKDTLILLASPFPNRVVISMPDDRTLESYV
jgi:hypothetical protein